MCHSVLGSIGAATLPMLKTRGGLPQPGNVVVARLTLALRPLLLVRAHLLVDPGTVLTPLL